MAREYEVPEYNEAIMCPECGEKSDVITGLYGLFGGGLGPYTCCEKCGMIVTKSYDGGKDAPEDYITSAK